MEKLGGVPLLAPDRSDRLSADPLVGRLFPPLATGVHWGLERTEQALAFLGNPQTSYRTVHIGGTNGKGSVTSTVASILQESGRRTACYTSPHLCSFRERMLVDRRAIPEATLLRYAAEVRPAVVRFELTFFEAATVLAFHTFAREAVDVAAIEVGLGGRLDATNVLHPVLAAVTNVAMDHAEYLGDSLTQIAREKAGIMKRGVPFITAEAEPGLVELFEDLAGGLDTPIFHVPSDVVRDVVVSRDRTTFRASTAAWGELEVVTPLVGRHQATNAALAIEICARLPEVMQPNVVQLLRGVETVDYRGRDEIKVIDGLTWLFDVAHNTAGVASLTDTLDRLDLPRPLVVLIGVLGDKDWRRMLPPLFSRADGAMLTVPPSAPVDRRWDPATAAADVGCAAPIEVEEDFAKALRDAARRALGGTVVVTGSVHTVGGAMGLLGIDPLR